MRRLYSTFAGGWPGIGLLLMRLIVGAVLLTDTGAKLWTDPTPDITVTSASLAVSGLLLLAGLWTPIAGSAVAAIEIFRILKVAAHPVVSLLAATIAAGLAMLGPGRWSVDARLFGWRRIEPPARGNRQSAL